jgi:hypothetical protein
LPEDKALPETAERHQPRKILLMPRLPGGRGLNARKIVFGAVAALWISCAGLTLLEGTAAFRSFLYDIATQSRLLLVIPLLFLGEAPLASRLVRIGQQFVSAKIVENSGRSVVEQEIDRLERNRISALWYAVLWSSCLGLNLLLLHQLNGSVLYLRWYRLSGSPSLSAAGWWYYIAILPTVEVLLVRILWKQWRWALLLYRVSRLKLRLIATHPDRVGGLGFLEWSEWEYLPLCLAVGTLFAGEIANRIVYGYAHLSEFKYIAAIPVIAILIVCVLPLFAFYGPLLRAKREAVFSHGRIGVTIGRIFEDKWLPDSIHWNQSVLSSHDVPGAKYFASIVENVYKMKLLPIGGPMIIRLVVCTLLPMVPVVLAALPFDMLMQQVLKILL